MPSITRRRLLAGGAAVAACGYGGYRLVRGAPDAAFGTWTPEPGTWPLDRYDPANTAHNPHASPPRETPAARELASIASAGGDDPYHVPLAGPDGIAVFGTQLAAESGGSTPYGEVRAGFAGFGPDGRLHAVRRTGTDTEIVGYDGDERAYRATVPGHAEGLTVGRDELYVGTIGGDVVAYDGGSRNWTVDGETTALSDGRLYTAGGRDGALAYRERDRPARLVSPGPERAWTAPAVRGTPDPPAVADSRLVVGTRGMSQGALAAFDAETGDGVATARPAVEDVSGKVTGGTVESVVLRLLLSPGTEVDEFDLREMVLRYLGPVGVFDLVHDSAGTGDATFTTTAKTDADDSAPVLNDGDDRIDLEFDVSALRGDDGFTGGETVSVHLVTPSGETTTVLLFVPESLPESGEIPL